MNIIDIIAKKRDRRILEKEEIEYFVKEYTEGNITDYQTAALIMAIYINGMNDQETTDLTLAMANSGEILNLNKLGDNIVDKHSTGGVGDKVTIILMPIIASLDIPVAKMSGRGLGFTGGTIDKLESIPGYNTGIDIDNFLENVKKINISLIGQTLNLAPADKKIYALRDTIGCVESIPLIASSIMSKKIASGASKIVLDVTVGDGAFMKDVNSARKLAIMMKKIGELAKKETVCVLTNMEEPLGRNVGNILEIQEAVEALKGNMEQDVKEVVLELGSYMIKLAGKGDNLEENKQKILENITNGKAYNKFLELVQNQGGDIEYIKDINKLKKAQYIYKVVSKKSGYVKELKAEEIGRISAYLGAGRIRKEDTIDKSVGIELCKKIGDKVEADEVLAIVHSNDESKIKIAIDNIERTYKIVEEKTEKLKTIIEVIV